MKRIIIVLISVFVVFCGTLLIVDAYMNRQATNLAERQNTQLLNDFSNNLNAELTLAAHATENFMTGLFSVRYDSTANPMEPTFVLEDRNIPQFIQTIHTELPNFLRLNDKVRNAAILVNDSVSQANTQYGFYTGYLYALTLQHDVPVPLDGKNLMKTESYRQLRESRKAMWILPFEQSNLREKYVFYCVPLFCENGSWFGNFIINFDISSIRQQLESHLPYGKGQSEMYITCSDSRIVASVPEIYEKYGSHKELAQNGVQNHLVDKIEYEGNSIYTYFNGERWQLRKSLVPAANWIVYSANKESAIYRDVYNLRWIILCVSFLGMILMFVCCGVIFRQVSKDLKKKAMAENEIQMAAAVQSSILSAPEYTSEAAHLNAFLRPARDAGGDLYCYLEREGHLIFCIGDVSGKGMPAALFMTQVHSLFRDAASHSLSPDKIVEEINNVLAVHNPDMTFCTFIVGVLKGGKLTFCNAGHNKPVVLRKGEEPFFLDMCPHLPLGLVEDFPYGNESLTLNPGDKLVLYTDGVTEAKNSQHADFGDSRLLLTLSQNSENPNQQILSAVEGFVGSYEQSDDITMLTLSCL